MRLQRKEEGLRGELRYDCSLRRTGGRNDTDYLLNVPETASRLRAALEDSLAGRDLIEMSIADLRTAVHADAAECRHRRSVFRESRSRGQGHSHGEREGTMRLPRSSGLIRKHRRGRNPYRRADYRNETEYLLASPANVRWIMAALEEARTGRVVSPDEIDAAAGLVGLHEAG